MKSVVYERYGGPEVLHVIERADPTPGPGEVLVRVAFSGVNPTDWKSRQGSSSGQNQALPFPQQVPNQDGSGTVVAVGAGVEPARVGQRVWLWEAAYQRSEGSAQELLALPEGQAMPLAPGASMELGASLAIPAMTAHRCLTVGEEGPPHLGPGTLSGRKVLVAGGAGAVGHAAIELALWSGAEVVTTVSTADKEELVRKAGARHVVNYREQDAAAEIRHIFPDGVDQIVEVAPAANASLDQAVLAAHGAVATYASDAPSMALAIRPGMVVNARFQFILVYTEPEAAKRRALEDVQRGLIAGVFRVGADGGLPLHRFSLEQAGQAHAAVEANIVGKVLIEI
ncbi:MAG: NADPH:quinone reductase [Candidatus Dormiibacterota bacterium]